jgi:hypothetical protein
VVLLPVQTAGQRVDQKRVLSLTANMEPASQLSKVAGISFKELEPLIIQSEESSTGR